MAMFACHPLTRESRLTPIPAGLLTLLLCLSLSQSLALGAEAPAKKKAPPASSRPQLVSSPANPALNKPAPANAADLAAIETQVRKVIARLLAATVSVQVGETQGSGVVVTKDGYVLTAAHVAGEPGRDVLVILSDAKRVEAKSLGLNTNADVGLLKITTPGEYQFAPMSDLKSLTAGTWCIATGHPGGYESGRPPVVRLGRVSIVRPAMLQTDCTLVGGDSGGPLFDLEGNVIGIHSRIGGPIALNLHIPVREVTDHWDRFAASERMGGRNPAQKVLLGVNGENHPKGARLTAIYQGMPASAAGLSTGDIVTRIDDVEIHTFEEMKSQIARKSAGDTITIQLLRGEKSLTISAPLIAYP
jgi:serine protease Do